jgi:DNA topoisomerase II
MSSYSDAKTRSSRSVKDYDVFSESREHVLARPGTYVGCNDGEPATMLTLPAEGNQVVSTDNVIAPEGMIRVFMEVVSNAVDNILATLAFDSANVDRTALVAFMKRNAPVRISVSEDSKTITVWNTGAPIPVTPHGKVSSPEALRLIPEVVFGTMYSSSNYSEDMARIGAGLNGLGCKLTSIFSTHFETEVLDTTHSHQHYQGKWADNMSRLVESIATPGYKLNKATKEWESAGDPSVKRGKAKLHTSGTSFVRVAYTLDWKRFSGVGDFYKPEVVNLFRRIALDCSFTAKIPIEFTGPDNKPLRLDARLPTRFVKYYFPDAGDEAADKSVIHYEWKRSGDKEAAARIGKGKGAIAKAIAEGALPIPQTEIIVIDTPDAGRSLGYVNGLFVPEGVHVREAYAQIGAAMIAAVPPSLIGKGGATTISANDVKAHVTIIVNCHLQNPDFSGQMKQVLTKPRPRFEFAPDEFRTAMTSKVSRWGVVERLVEAAEVKAKRTAAKTDGRKKKRVAVEGAVDANFAGTSKSSQCTLWLTEGDSAAAYTAKRVDHTPGRKDTNGIFGLRGKLINARSASTSSLCENKEYCALKALIGLSEGAKYTTTDTLRYGRVCIAADADDDGSAIRALIINCFATRWPSLVAKGFLAYLATPAIRVSNPSNGEVVERFYSDSAFYEWAKTNEAALKGMRVRHIKGLASSNDRDIKDDMITAPTIHIVFDDTAEESLDLAFSSKRADDRKVWIENWRVAVASGGLGDADDIVLEPLSRAAAVAAGLITGGVVKRAARKAAAAAATQATTITTGPPIASRTVSAIVNRDLAEFSFSSLFRAIVSFRDGLKRSQRQALWHCLRFWNFGMGAGGIKDSMKVARLASAVSEAVSYAHGETSMQGTLVTLAQDFTGSNNLPLLLPDGQFGSRTGGPTVHGAPRYIYTKTNWVVPLIFSDETLSLVPRRSVEGETVETEWIPCDIALAAVNGARGIATGWSTHIPCHKPSEVVAWTANRLTGKETKSPSIWYNGFKGTLEIVTSGDTGRRNLISKGIYTSKPSGEGVVDVEITELPIGGLWIKGYRDWLESLVTKGIALDFEDKSTSDEPHFIVKKISLAALFKETKTKDLDFNSLRLVTTTSLNNMVLIDTDGTPKRYATVDDILESHFIEMRSIYVKVKEARIAKLDAELVMLKARHALLAAIVSGALKVFLRKRVDVLADVKKMQLSEEIYLKLKIDEATDDHITETANEIASVEEKLISTKKMPSDTIWLTRLSRLHSELEKRGL